MQYTLSFQKRILKYTRHYFYYKLSPFSIAVALPKTYGFNYITFKNFKTGADIEIIKNLQRSKNWFVHPEW